MLIWSHLTSLNPNFNISKMGIKVVVNKTLARIELTQHPTHGKHICVHVNIINIILEIGKLRFIKVRIT